MRSIVRLIVIALLVSAIAVTASAQATRTWVSGVGDDANPCSRTAPCKTFAGAISKTANHGEISVLDPGGFGAVTITKSMTIDGTGQVSSILAASVTGVIINATSTDRIYLKNLTINGANTGLNGVRVLQAKHVTVENTYIWNFTTGVNGSRGLRVENTSNEVFLTTENVSIRDISGLGIELIPTGTGSARAAINNTRISDVTQSAIVLEANSRANISYSSLTSNAGAGVLARRTTSEANVAFSVLSRNGFGVNVGNTDGGLIRLYASQVADNTISGLSITAPGTVVSHGNNAIRGNVGNEVPSSNALTQ
jgi:Right handed beta helix region